MGQMGHGYGSEFHLLRIMGRHREYLNQELARQSGLVGTLRWLDFRFRNTAPHDREWEGIDFLQVPEVRRAWRDFWPQTGSAPNWDAVGWLSAPQGHELILCEAKAHTGELGSTCRAEGASRDRIEGVLAETKRVLGITPSHDWMTGYYQFANRLSVLRFMNEHGVYARMVIVCFTDNQQVGTESPRDAAGWAGALKRQDAHLGLGNVQHPLLERVHKVFLSVAGR